MNSETEKLAREKRQMDKELSQLVGAEVIRFETLVYRGEIYPRLVLKAKSGATLIAEAQTENASAGKLAIFEQRGL